MNEQLKFECGLVGDPDAGRSASEEESASWGWFRLTIGGVNVCQHIANGKILDRVDWYMLPVIEWFVENWDPLLHEVRLPVSMSDAQTARDAIRRFTPGDDDELNDAVFDWRERHALRAAAPGAIVPDVFLKRTGDHIELSWGHARLAGAPLDLRFLAASEYRLLEPRQAAETLYDSFNFLTNELVERLPNNSRLQTLALAMKELKLPRSLQRTAWIAGVGKSVKASAEKLTAWSSLLPSAFKSLIEPVAEELVVSRTPAAVLMFGTLSPEVSEQDVSVLLGVLENATLLTEQKPSLPDSSTFIIGVTPWEGGYELALHTRNQMQLSDEVYKIDIDKILEEYSIRQTHVELSDSKIRAIAISGETFAPTITMNDLSRFNDTDPGRRFTLAHELCHILYDRGIGVQLAVASGPWAPAVIEKRANAFAAMFLMPLEACSKLLHQYSVTGTTRAETITAIANTFGTSRMATLHHLHNIDLVNDVDFEMILEEMTQ